VAVIFRVEAERLDAALIERAAAMIRDGLVVAYPTDTLYGLAVDPRNSEAVRRLFALKGRPETSALTLIASGNDQVTACAELSPLAERLATQFWPGPLTIVMRANATIAVEALAGGETVGIRVPGHPIAVALARAAGVCITATSANRSGEPPATTADGVARALPDVEGIVVGGPARGGPPSTIVDATGRVATLIRAGAVPFERVLHSS
jgi:L-threonylcarbamoyladenylate synthase